MAKRFVTRTSEELEKDFRDAFAFLKASAASYDAGFHREAARLANVIMLFVHDRGKTKSLLTLLRKKSIKFVNTARPINLENLLTESPLLWVKVGAQSISYEPLLGGGPPECYSLKPQFFEAWWGNDVLRDNKRRLFSRKNIIYFLRNKDLGGHIDSQLDEEYSDFTRHNSLGWFLVSGESRSVPEAPAHYATARQISWELQKTLEEQCAELLV